MVMPFEALQVLSMIRLQDFDTPVPRCLSGLRWLLSNGMVESLSPIGTQYERLKSVRLTTKGKLAYKIATLKANVEARA